MNESKSRQNSNTPNRLSVANSSTNVTLSGNILHQAIC
jgi:hypothetical protein